MEEMFKKLKEKYNGAIIFFKLGEYYETFFEDAEVLGRECWFTYQKKDVMTCSVPQDYIDKCVERLESLGHKVEILKEDA